MTINVNNSEKKKEWANKKITSRTENYSKWYSDIIRVAELAEYGLFKGSMIIKPNGYAIWEMIQKILDEKFKETGVRNVYFPSLIPEKFLKKEAEHVKGFSPEVAVVTYAGGKKLKEALVIRPTSETVIYEAFSRWIQSYKDLPILINQWVNVIRWEMRPRLFLRTTEFLWQEGHTAHATEQEADERARMMLNVYKDFAENYMAIPVILGFKSETEKFAGAFRTYTLEAIMQDGKALQLATSHNLGQNFSKVFNLGFVNKNNVAQYVWQTSWGLSTRTIGALIMVHSDDKGLILPPKLAPLQVVIVPIWSNVEIKELVIKKANSIKMDFKEDKIISIKLDDRDIRPGEKYFEWEKKGIPLRIELGPKDIEKNSAILVRRDTGEKKSVSLRSLKKETYKILDEIQTNLYKRALQFRNNRIKSVDNWKDFKDEIKKGNFVLAHWCDESEVEAKIKAETKATIRCIPFDKKTEQGKCVYSGKPSNRRVLFAKAY